PIVRPTYYSRVIGTSPTPSVPRRARQGSLARPVNGRLYRGTWLFVALPLLLAAFTVVRPTPLPEPPLPATFDRTSAVTLTRDLAREYPDRSPGSAGAAGAIQWYANALALYKLQTETDAFSATIPGRGRVTLRNLLSVLPGRSPQEIGRASCRG